MIIKVDQTLCIDKPVNVLNIDPNVQPVSGEVVETQTRSILTAITVQCAG